MLGLGATHGSEIVHIQHSYASYLGRKLHPLGRRVQPSVGRRMQRTWLDFATGELGQDWPRYDAQDTPHPGHPFDAATTPSPIPTRVRRSAWDGAVLSRPLVVA